MITTEMVKDMTHVERMTLLGKTVADRVKACEMMVSDNSKTRAAGKKLHDDAARAAHVIRY